MGDILVGITGLLHQTTHIFTSGSDVTLCGIAITAGWLFKKFLWAGKVGCKDCRREYGEMLDKERE